MVESDEPAWSVNVKKAAASTLQLDVTGVRSAVDGGVFGERSSTLNSLEVIRSEHNEALCDYVSHYTNNRTA